MNEATVRRRSSPRFLNKRSDVIEEKLPTRIEEKVWRKGKRASNAREEPEVSIVPVINMANDFGSIDINAAQKLADANAHNLVLKTLRVFNKHYLHFVQEEEQRIQGIYVNASKMEEKMKNKNGFSSPKRFKVDQQEQIIKRGSKRPDLKAISKMIEDRVILYPTKRIGHLPGIMAVGSVKLRIPQCDFFAGVVGSDAGRAAAKIKLQEN